jgi:hypothetical protein
MKGTMGEEMQHKMNFDKNQKMHCLCCNLLMAMQISVNVSPILLFLNKYLNTILQPKFGTILPADVING